MNKVDLKEIEDYLEECAISENFLYPQYQITLLIQEYKNLHSIIKEVREYIERYLNLNLEAFDTRNLLEKELEILDKVNK